MKTTSDFNHKIEAIRQMLKGKDYDGLEINSQANFSYVTRGRGFIGLASVMACGSLVILQNQVYLISENIEIERLYVEQLGKNPMIEPISYPWDEPEKRHTVIGQITKGLKVASEADVQEELFTLRTLITPEDQEDYRSLCHETATILETICKGLVKGISEYELAGKIANQLWRHNIEPITTLIAFDERAIAYRHPVMTSKQLANYALVGICGRRNGLIVSLSRDVLLKEDQEMMEKHKQCAQVQGAFFSGLKPGQTLDSVYRKGIEAYAMVGYPLEHKAHHQGGLTGFIPRELRANLGCNHLVRCGEAYAFNPTLQGAKCEDTVLVTDNGLEVMTYTGNYNYVTCQTDGQSYRMPTVYVIHH